MALRFYACGAFYQVIGDSLCFHKSTISFLVHRLSSALASLVRQFVYFPNNPEHNKRIKHKFFDLGKMPNTIGVIDCTDVHIQAPHEREWEFVNRKGWHSINVQLVGDADLIITNCVVKWPGSVQDAQILRESNMLQIFQQNPPEGIILGDSANDTDAQERFNSAHGTTRSTIERLNGTVETVPHRRTPRLRPGSPPVLSLHLLSGSPHRIP
ncbi:HARB1 nuclease, partial [Amia calva]|nr:HARB1 nuclease [Amia calva]